MRNYQTERARLRERVNNLNTELTNYMYLEGQHATDQQLADAMAGFRQREREISNAHAANERRLAAVLGAANPPIAGGGPRARRDVLAARELGEREAMGEEDDEDNFQRIDPEIETIIPLRFHDMFDPEPLRGEEPPPPPLRGQERRRLAEALLSDVLPPAIPTIFAIADQMALLRTQDELRAAEMDPSTPQQMLDDLRLVAQLSQQNLDRRIAAAVAEAAAAEAPIVHGGANGDDEAALPPGETGGDAALPPSAAGEAQRLRAAADAAIAASNEAWATAHACVGTSVAAQTEAAAIAAATAAQHLILEAAAAQLRADLDGGVGGPPA